MMKLRINPFVIVDLKNIKEYIEEDKAGFVLKHGKPMVVIISNERYERLLKEGIDINEYQEMEKKRTMAVKKSELYSMLWEACNKLRGGVEPARYKDYVLVLLFHKYVSDRYKGQPYAMFTVKPGTSFDDLIAAKGKPEVGERVDKIIQKFLEDNHLQGALPDVSFNNADELGSGKELVDKVSGLIGVFQNPAIDFRTNRASGDDIIN